MPRSARQAVPLLFTAALCVPWLASAALRLRPSPPWEALLPGLCVVGAAFLLSWASEAAEVDVPQGLAIGLLALVAVLPEYAVDIYFAWKAGRNPAYAAFAAANMTGGNRLLLGLGWPAVVLASRLKQGHREVHLPASNRIELEALLGATLYSFILPLKGSLSWIDSVVLLAWFGRYAWRAAGASGPEPVLEGPAALIARLPVLGRRLTVLGLYVFSAVAIGVSAKPFAEGLLASGRRWGIDEFLLVQWLAPLASEAPELIAAVAFAVRGRASVGLRTLVSSKVNQWTLLVGSLPLAACLSAGKATALPLDARQIEELFLTSAQSLFGLAVLSNLRLSLAESAGLFGLFALQLAFPGQQARWACAFLYLVLAAAAFRDRRSAGRS